MVDNENQSEKTFSNELYCKMIEINPGIAQMEMYEFCYALNNITPPGGWNSVLIESKEEIEKKVNDRKFYDSIRIKDKVDDKVTLDPQIVILTQQLIVGLNSNAFPIHWIQKHFYFDIRGFFFLHRTEYFDQNIIEHLGGKPYLSYEKKQTRFETVQDIGYKAFKEANMEIDQALIETVGKLIPQMGTPLLIAIAGPTAAGKTEIVERLTETFQKGKYKITAIELDNFLTDRDYREEKGIFTQGKEALHFQLLIKVLNDISKGLKISIPRYDFVEATSSHDLEGNLKPGGIPIEIEPADIIFIEGNFPFLLSEISSLIGLKIVYLTDDPIRLKRKWKRDIDYRKKYEPSYFRNRYFKDQFIMAGIAYRPQMLLSDMVIDTTGAAVWISPKILDLLNSK